jgi:hypothetical protein
MLSPDLTGKNYASSTGKCKYLIKNNYSMEFRFKKDMNCTFNITCEARSDISSVKLMKRMTVASLPWQPQCALVNGVGGREILLETHLGFHA